MPVEANTGEARTDVNMTATSGGDAQVIEVEEFPDPEKPPPPFEPIIEDVTMQDTMGNPGITRTEGPYIETVGEFERVEQVSAAPWKPNPTYTPVTLTPADRNAREDAERPKTTYVEPTPKASFPTPKATLVPRTQRTEKEKTEVKEEPMPERGTSSSSSVPTTKMAQRSDLFHSRRSRKQKPQKPHQLSRVVRHQAQAPVLMLET